MSSAADEAPDAELAARAGAGDEGAFRLLVKRHERRVYNLAYRMLGREEDARDAAQDAFLSAYRRLATFRGDAAFGTWLHRITVNASYDILRKRKNEPVLRDELPEPSPAADHGDRAAAAVDVQRALLGVPVEYRAVVVLHDLLGRGFEDIAEALEVPVGTVKSRLHRGRVAMGRVLGIAATAEPRALGDPLDGGPLRLGEAVDPSMEPEGDRAPSKPATP
ncbi:MAG TPA: sigma-70 family RNA polymerase sigma factor [Actinomycetota bacterium]|nr:sigma-70 family RNA polymerase sigma factor [Actinomycetota bacterium]